MTLETIYTCFLYRIARKVLGLYLNIAKALKKYCFEMFTREKTVNMKIVIKKFVRNSEF